MPGKRRSTKPAPSQKPPPKPAPAPAPAPSLAPPSPPLSPPQPPESSASKVRREWQSFIADWYHPRLKKLQDHLHADLAPKHSKPPFASQHRAKQSDLLHALAQLPARLAWSARTEWERRLEAAHLREDQWDDMTCEEQQAVLNVFVGFFGDDDGHQPPADGPPSASLSPRQPDSTPEDLSQPPSSFPPRSSPSIPANTFEFVNPTSLFVESLTPLNPPKKLPALSMDHLATLGPSNTARQADSPSTIPGPAGGPGFHNWASEVGFPTQQLQSQPSIPPSQTLAARPRATEHISRQASAISTISSSSPALFANRSSPPQSSPPTKASPPAATDALALGKRYIGPVIFEEEPLDDDLLKSRMAAEFEEFKNSLRIQMIYDFHAEAAEIEIKLVETLLNDQGTKESRAKAVQEHEMHMMALRGRKEGERKRLCAEERERRREHHRTYLAQAALRSSQNREPDPSPFKGAPSKSSDSSAPQSLSLGAQKDTVPTHHLTPAAPRPEPPSAMKKSSSVLSQVDAVSNEAIFAEAAAMLAQGKLAPTPSQPPKKPNGVHPPNNEIPQITVHFADPPASVSAPVPVSSAKGKKARKKAGSIPEPDVDAEPPPRTKGAWGIHTVQSKSPEDSLTPGVHKSSEKKTKTVTFTDEPHIEVAPPSVSPWSSVNDKHTKNGKTAQRQQPDPVALSSSSCHKTNKASVPSTASKKSRTATVSEELEDKEDAWSSPTPTPFSVQQNEVKAAWLPKQTKLNVGSEPRRGMETPARVEAVSDSEDEYLKASPGVHAPASEVSEEDDDWLDKENAEYWRKFIEVNSEAPVQESPAAVPADHAVWTPSVDPDSDEDESEDGFAGELWMQLAISRGEIPGLTVPAGEPEVARVEAEPNVWGYERTRQRTGVGKAVSMLDRAVGQGGAPWAKMENRLSSVGQNSSSTRFL